MKKSDYLKKVVEHIDIKSFDARPILKAYSKMAFQARNLAVAADIYDRMLKDEKCKVILTLAGSLFSAGLKNVVADMVENNMVDAIVSTGALIVDQDFFEALGYKHYIGTPFSNDNELRDLAIDRIYDTYIDEDELRVCDLTIAEIKATARRQMAESGTAGVCPYGAKSSHKSFPVVTSFYGSFFLFFVGSTI